MLKALNESKRYFDGMPFVDVETGVPTEERVCGLLVEEALEAANIFKDHTASLL